MENEACLAAIRNQYNTLTKTERQIADYILANSSSVVEMSVADLAAASAAAGSAVIRFCKTIGYTGFSQFRITLAMELASRPAPVMPLLTNSDTSADAARKVFDSSVRTLQNTLSMLDFSIVEALVNEILQAERICIFGVGTSSPIAEDTGYRFLQLGLSASSYKDILFMPVAAMNMKKGELAIAISHSGRPPCRRCSWQRGREPLPPPLPATVQALWPKPQIILSPPTLMTSIIPWRQSPPGSPISVSWMPSQ